MIFSDSFLVIFLLLFNSFHSFLEKSSFADGPAIAATFVVLGFCYLIYMLFAALLVRVKPSPPSPPPPSSSPSSSQSLSIYDSSSSPHSNIQDEPSISEIKVMEKSSPKVSAKTAITLRQFWFLWIVLFCNVTAGIGILEQAAPMIQDFFPLKSSSSRASISPSAAGGYVGFLSLGNLLGRFLWSSLSDKVGRKVIYSFFFLGGMSMYVTLAFAGHRSPYVFVTLTFLILSFYGGGFACMPAYLKDLFGTHEVGAIHGRVLTSWSAAGIVGPLIVNLILDFSSSDGKSLTYLAYRPALIVMACILMVGFIANLLIMPVDPKYFIDSGSESGGTAERDNLNEKDMVESFDPNEMEMENRDKENETERDFINFEPIPLDGVKNVSSDGNEIKESVDPTLDHEEREEEMAMSTLEWSVHVCVIVFSWIVVTVPFGFGLFVTLSKTVQLFRS